MFALLWLDFEDARGDNRSDKSAMTRSQRGADCDFWLKSALDA